MIEGLALFVRLPGTRRSDRQAPWSKSRGPGSRDFVCGPARRYVCSCGICPRNVEPIDPRLREGCHRNRRNRLISRAWPAIEDVTPDCCNAVEAGRPIGRYVIGMIMGGAHDAYRIESVERVFCYQARTIHDRCRKPAVQRAVTGEAELAPRPAFGAGKNHPADRLWIGGVAKPVKDDFGNSLLASDRLVSSLVRDRIGEARDGTLPIVAAAFACIAPLGLSHRHRRKAQQDDTGRQEASNMNSDLLPPDTRTAMEQIDCISATIRSGLAFLKDRLRGRRNATSGDSRMRFFAALASLAMISGCATPVLSPVEVVQEQAYRLRAGDRVRIVTYGEQYLTGEYTVNGVGEIQFPLIGNVAVAGMSTAQLRDEIVIRLGAEFLRSPRIAIEVASYHPVYILGEVAKPGEVPFSERMTVFAVVAKAGGFTYRANRKYVYVRRENEAVEKAFPFSPNLAVQPGDQIRIPAAIF